MELPEPESMLRAIESAQRVWNRWLNITGTEVVPVATNDTQPAKLTDADVTPVPGSVSTSMDVMGDKK